MRIARLLTSIKPESPLGCAPARAPQTFAYSRPRFPRAWVPGSTLGRAGDEVMRDPAAVPACPQKNR